MSHRIYVGNASASTERKGWGDAAIKETLRSLFDDSHSLHGDLSEPLAMKDPGWWRRDARAKSTLWISSIPNSSLSLCYGEREEDGENGCEDGREVREAERWGECRKRGDGVVRDGAGGSRRIAPVHRLKTKWPGRGFRVRKWLETRATRWASAELFVGTWWDSSQPFSSLVPIFAL